MQRDFMLVREGCNLLQKLVPADMETRITSHEEHVHWPILIGRIIIHCRVVRWREIRGLATALLVLPQQIGEIANDQIVIHESRARVGSQPPSYFPLHASRKLA